MEWLAWPGTTMEVGYWVNIWSLFLPSRLGQMMDFTRSLESDCWLVLQ